MRRLATLTAVLAALAAMPATVPAAAGHGGDNTAIAINTRDDSSVFRLAFSIRRVTDGIVDHANAAVAYSSCERCTATAIAIQAVLVGVQADTVTPTNVAIAINEQCTSCTSMAFAYQFVLGTEGPAHFTPEGNRAVRDIRRRLHELRHAQPSPTEFDSRISALMDELRTVLDEELVTRGLQEQPRPPQPREPRSPEEAANELPLDGTDDASPDTGVPTAEPPGETDTAPRQTDPPPDDSGSVTEGSESPSEGGE